MSEKRSPGRPPGWPPVRRVMTGPWTQLGRYSVGYGEMIVGTSNLEYVTEPGLRVAGRFQPTSAFWQIVSVFHRYRVAVNSNSTAKLREYVRMRDALRLELLDGGARLAATIELITGWSSTHWMVHVATTDERFWQLRYNRPNR